MDIVDQCRHCTVRGDIKECLSVPCFQHENWYSKHQQEEIKNQTAAIEIFNREFKLLEKKLKKARNHRDQARGMACKSIPTIRQFIGLCDTLDNTCLGNGMDDMVSVGKAQYMALINYANEMRGE